MSIVHLSADNTAIVSNKPTTVGEVHRASVHWQYCVSTKATAVGDVPLATSSGGRTGSQQSMDCPSARPGHHGVSTTNRCANKRKRNVQSGSAQSPSTRWPASQLFTVEPVERWRKGTWPGTNKCIMAQQGRTASSDDVRGTTSEPDSMTKLTFLSVCSCWNLDRAICASNRRTFNWTSQFLDLNVPSTSYGHNNDF